MNLKWICCQVSCSKCSPRKCSLNHEIGTAAGIQEVTWLHNSACIHAPPATMTTRVTLGLSENPPRLTNFLHCFMRNEHSEIYCTSVSIASINDSCDPEPQTAEIEDQTPTSSQGSNPMRWQNSESKFPAFSQNCFFFPRQHNSQIPAH